jgi:signal transduction histidine kinase/CheY-like chemotaxis protein
MEERALIWAGGRDGTLTSGFLKSARFEAESFRNCDEICRELQRGAAVLILAAEVLSHPESGRLRELLIRQPKWSDIPVVVVAGRTTGTAGALNHMLSDFNGVSVLHRPLSLDTLISTVGAALRARRRQYQVRDLLQHRDETDRRREEFLAMLAHELRNPLSPIRTGLQVLRITESEELAARVRSMMERQVGNLSRLIDDLLDVSRITRGKISLKMQAVEIFQILNVVVEGRARLAAEKGLHVEFVDRESPALWVKADPMRLEQMIDNIVSNAIKYTPEKGLISIRATREDSNVVIRIKDTGIGIPAEMLGTVFELFAQTDRALDRSQGGLGIGLTIVKTLAELHDGSVEALSAGEGHGTEIILRLPALVATDNVIEARGVKPSPTQFPSRTVLVVEDNREAVDILATYLRAQGHTVHVAYDGRSGLESALRERPDAILCDIGLPVMDGYALARTLRNAPTLANCLLVAVTGYGETRDKERGQQAGFDHYLVKPADPEEIARLLASH